MVYPQEFSAQARARVEAERLKAGNDLAQYRDRPETRPPCRQHTWGTYGRRWTDDEEDFFEYILRVFLAFGHEACELGKRGTWAVDRIRSEADKFLRRFGMEAYNEKGYDRSGHKFRQMTDGWYGTLLPEVEQEFQKSEQWRRFEGELLAVAERQAAQNSESGGDEPAQTEAGPAGNGTDGGGTKRLRATVTSPVAARRMEAYMESHGGQTKFAIKVGTTDRTLRSFRRNGRVRPDIFDAIAGAMGTTPEELLKPE